MLLSLFYLLSLAMVIVMAGTCRSIIPVGDDDGDGAAMKAHVN